MTINARSEMDLEEDSILEKVAKASGANFGFHKEKARPMPEQGPVVRATTPLTPHPSPLTLPPTLTPSSLPFSSAHVMQGSVYKKADPKADISSRARDQFWAKQEVQ